MPPVVVTFAIEPDLGPAEQDLVLAAVAAVPGVIEVSRLLPRTDIADLLRLGTAVVDSAADPAAVLELIRQIDGIEFVDVAADRGEPP